MLLSHPCPVTIAEQYCEARTLVGGFWSEMPFFSAMQGPQQTFSHTVMDAARSSAFSMLSGVKEVVL
jgi:hypothetical protein